MKIRSILVLAMALVCAPAFAQVTPGTSPLSISKGGTGSITNGISIAAMKALTKQTNGSTVYVSGYYAVGDGGEGSFSFATTCPNTPDNGVYITPTAGGSGCWVRNTYSTQPNIRWWGAVCNGTGAPITGTDDSGAFNSAVTWATAQHGAHIGMPRGAICALASTIVISTGGVFFEGLGAATFIQSVGTVTAQCSALVAWTGAANLSMFSWQPAGFGPTVQGIHGGGLSNICLNGQNVAGFGYIIVSMRNGNFDTIYLTNFTQWAAYYTVAPAVNGNHQIGETCDTQQNFTKNLVIDQYIAAGGLMLLDGNFNSTTVSPPGSPDCNVSANTFVNITTGQISGRGIVEASTDDNVWIGILQFVPLGPTDPYGFEWTCSTLGTKASTAACANNDYLYGVTLGKSIARGTTSFPTNIPASQNTIFGLDKGQSPDPEVEAGASPPTVQNSDGRLNNITGLSVASIHGQVMSVSSCGTGASVTGNPVRGTVSTGTGVGTTCQINFPVALSAPPICTFTTVGSIVALGAQGLGTASAITAAAVSTMPGFFNYHCID